MGVSTQVWIITCAVILGLFVFDFRPRAGSARSELPGVGDLVDGPHHRGGDFRSLFVWWQWAASTAGVLRRLRHREGAVGDNLFVFTVIMASFKVPRIYQQKLLLIGIVMALAMRAVFAPPAYAINTFRLGVLRFRYLPIGTALKLARESGRRARGGGGGRNRLVTLVRRFVPDL